MADKAIPATLAGLVVVEVPELGPRVRLQLEAKKSDWDDVEALEGIPGVVVMPGGVGVLLDPTVALVSLK